MKDLKVLVIDPDFDYLQLISQFLSNEGFHIVTATDGEEGLRKAMIESPDLILMEPMLSKLHGFTLCNIVSKEFKKKIPVIILTNHYQDSHYKKEAIQVYGAAAFLMRPIMKKELRSTIFDVLGKKSMEGIEETPDLQVSEVNGAIKEMSKESTSSEVVTERAQDRMDEVKKEVAREAPPKIAEDNTQALLAENQPENGKERPQEAPKETKAEEANVSPAKTQTESSGNNGNGSNGKSKVDRMIDDIETEFGLINVKKMANNNSNLQI